MVHAKLISWFERSGSPLLLAALFWVTGSLPVLAHATLVSASPADGAVLSTAPQELSLDFNEPVSPIILKLAYPDGRILLVPETSVVPAGGTLHITSMSVQEQGSYALIWRVISADGHPVSGIVGFSVGAPSKGKVALSADETPEATKAAIIVDRALLYMASFAGIGGVMALSLLGQPVGRLRRFLEPGLAIVILLAVLALGLQGLDVLAISPGNLFDAATWKAGFETSYADTLAVLVFASLVALFAGRVGIVSARPLSFFALVLMAGAFTLSGHASDARPHWLSGAAVFFHVVAIAFWIGALIPLVIALVRPTEQSARFLLRFSATIPFAIVVLLVSGLVLSILQMRHLATFAPTDYGRVLAIKLGIVAVIFLIALINRLWLTTPAVDALKVQSDGESALSVSRDAQRRLATMVLVELFLVAAVFSAVSLWRFTPPPRALIEAAQRPASVHMDGARLSADVTVTPGVVGYVNLTIDPAILGDEDIAIHGVAIELQSSAANDAPIRVNATLSEAGQWTVPNLYLAKAGTWTVSLKFALDGADSEALTGQVAILEE